MLKGPQGTLFGAGVLADIAAEWGLWHPSHFSQSFTDMFGQLPSRSRGSSLPRTSMTVPSSLAPAIAVRA